MTIEQKIKNLEELVETLKEYNVEYADIEQEIEWLTDYRNRLSKEEEFRPTTLYAIEHVPSGKIIFNARGGCYKHLEDANAKLSKYDCNYRIIKYKLQE